MRHVIPLDPYVAPPLSLNVNRHWARTAGIRRELSTLVWLRARGIGPYPHITVWLRWEPKVRRNRDGDNPAPTTKVCVDSLVKAGVVEGDTTDHVTHAPLELLPANPRLVRGRLWLVVDSGGDEERAA